MILISEEYDINIEIFCANLCRTDESSVHQRDSVFKHNGSGREALSLLRKFGTSANASCQLSVLSVFLRSRYGGEVYSSTRRETLGKIVSPCQEPSVWAELRCRDK